MKCQAVIGIHYFDITIMSERIFESAKITK